MGAMGAMGATGATGPPRWGGAKAGAKPEPAAPKRYEMQRGGGLVGRAGELAQRFAHVRRFAR
jgi:hypothetical protein